MSSSSSSSSHVTKKVKVTKADLLYTISCLLADIDIVVERLDTAYVSRDVGVLSDMVDDLVDARDLLLDVVPDGHEALGFLDLECCEADQAEEEDPSIPPECQVDEKSWSESQLDQ